jgi:hypothetical protein
LSLCGVLPGKSLPFGSSHLSSLCSSPPAYAGVAVASTAYAPMDAIATSTIMAYLVLFIGMTLAVQNIMDYAKLV